MCFHYSMARSRSLLGSLLLLLIGTATAVAHDDAIKAAETWLSRQPGPSRGNPPPENLNELRDAWISQGKGSGLIGKGLLAILLDNKSRFRRAAAESAGEVIGEKALPALGEILRSTSPQESSLKLNALTSVRAVHGTKKVAVLTTALEASYEIDESGDETTPKPSAIIRANIGLILGETEGNDAKVLLKQLIDKERDQYVLSLLKNAK